MQADLAQPLTASVGERVADRLLDLAAQVRRLDPPEGYDRGQFLLEMEELGAEIEGLGRGVVERLPEPQRQEAAETWK